MKVTLQSCEKSPGRRKKGLLFEAQSGRPLRPPHSVLALNQTPVSICDLCTLCRAIGGDREMNCIACQVPFGDHRHPVAKLDQTFRSGFRIVLDDDTATLERMTMGKHETHHPTCLAKGFRNYPVILRLNRFDLNAMDACYIWTRCHASGAKDRNPCIAARQCSGCLAQRGPPAVCYDDSQPLPWSDEQVSA